MAKISEFRQGWTEDEKTNCWNWNGAIGKYGYGHAKVDGLCLQAHKFVFEKKIKKVPKGLDLDHLCRNRKCVNPKHLEIVTRSENSQRGDLAKLDKKKVLKIREEFKNGKITQKELADQFGVHKSNIWFIVNNWTWKNV